MIEHHQLSERHACRLVGLSRDSYRNPPQPNQLTESFNGKFRDECLNEQWFQSLPQARTCIAEWRRDYNALLAP